ncbi:uncharacterized protein TNCV_907721 [Trichonephila clavipes]|nr:uncharacterized protein TNCV_907721 [Trichonephila clavipes]
MQVSFGTKNNSSPNEPSCTIVTVSFNGVLLVVTGTWRSPYLSPARISANLTWTRRKTSHKTTVVVSTMHALYSRLIAGDSGLRRHVMCSNPSTIKDLPNREADASKNSQGSNSSRWCGMVVFKGECQLRCRPRHVSVVRIYEVGHQ